MEPVVVHREIPDEGSLEEGKQVILSVCRAEPVEPNWYGTLTVDNVEQVAERIRLTLEDKTFALSEVLYVGSPDMQLRLDTDQFIIPGDWTDGSKEKVRVMRGNGACSIGFSTPVTYWTFNCAPTDDHEDYRYPHLSFEDNGTLMSFRQRAPAGHLHWRQFKVQTGI